jgi:hypothetical protein
MQQILLDFIVAVWYGFGLLGSVVFAMNGYCYTLGAGVLSGAQCSAP